MCALTFISDGPHPIQQWCQWDLGTYPFRPQCCQDWKTQAPPKGPRPVSLQLYIILPFGVTVLMFKWCRMFLMPLLSDLITEHNCIHLTYNFKMLTFLMKLVKIPENFKNFQSLKIP